MQTRYRPDLDSVQTIHRILQKPFRDNIWSEAGLPRCWHTPHGKLSETFHYWDPDNPGSVLKWVHDKYLPIQCLGDWHPPVITSSFQTFSNTAWSTEPPSYTIKHSKYSLQTITNLWVIATYVLIIFKSNRLHATGGNAQWSRQRCAFTLISAEMHNTLPKSKIFVYALLKALRVGNPDHIIFPKHLFKTNSFRQWCVLRVVTRCSATNTTTTIVIAGGVATFFWPTYLCLQQHDVMRAWRGKPGRVYIAATGTGHKSQIIYYFHIMLRNYWVFGKNVVAKISQVNHVWDSCVAITITNCNNLFRVKKSD